MQVITYLSLYPYISIDISLYTYVALSPSLSLYIYIYIYDTHVCVYTYIRTYTCVYECNRCNCNHMLLGESSDGGTERLFSRALDSAFVARGTKHASTRPPLRVCNTWPHAK